MLMSDFIYSKALFGKSIKGSKFFKKIFKIKNM